MNDIKNLSPGIAAYHYDRPGSTYSHLYLEGPVINSIQSLVPKGSKLFEIGAGNGYLAGRLVEFGYNVEGIEPSRQGVDIANQYYPSAKIRLGSVYDHDLGEPHSYDLIYSVEVIEHLYAPRFLIAHANKLLKPGGILIITTPFHGYFKNLMISVVGGWDRHFSPLWDHGHVKFWSSNSLDRLIKESQFRVVKTGYAGRIWPLSKSIIKIARKP